jgi:archaemetzincin
MCGRLAGEEIESPKTWLQRQVPDARYDPGSCGQAATADSRKLVLRRSCKVLAHESGHMFGIEHCVWYQCLMNGSSHLAEADARPLHLCLVDLRKLQWSIGFDVVD